MSSSSDSLSSPGSSSGTCEELADQLHTVLLLSRWILALVAILVFVCVGTWVLWCSGARLRVKKLRHLHHRIGDGLQSQLQQEPALAVNRAASGSGQYSGSDSYSG